MVGVVGDEELDDFFFLALFVFFHKGEDQASVGGVCSLHFEFFLASVNDGLPFATFAACHDKLDAVSDLPIRRVEGACAHQHTNHIEGAILAGESVVGGGIAVALVSHFDLALSVRITVPDIFPAIGFSFEGTFLVILGNEVKTGVSGECIAHHEDGVGAFGPAGDEVGLIGWLSVVYSTGDVH